MPRPGLTGPLGWALIGACWAVAASPAGTDIQEVMASLRGVERVDALYTETIESSLLATSLTSEGRIEYWAPSRIRKSTDAGYSVEVDGERVLVRRSDTVLEIAVQDHPGIERLVAGLRAVFAGDLGRLQRDYDLTFSTGPQQWEMMLRPLDRQFLSLFESIRIQGQGAAIARIDITSPDGNRRSMRLRPFPSIPPGSPTSQP
ncbi:MAG: outer membrane lipoprotein carrier protein LolA [Chromatiaceae bacterium]|nr:outer membrane lipoprotein carrier protein LolA [Chromatiaceae bacterium]